MSCDEKKIPLSQDAGEEAACSAEFGDVGCKLQGDEPEDKASK